MTYRQKFRKSRLAEWGFRLSVICAHIVVFTVLLHRYASQSTAVSLNLLQIGFVGALVAFGISLFAAFQIWNRLLSGFGKAIAGIFISLLILAWPASLLPLYLVTPKLYDISTDIKSPPAFNALLQFRSFGSNATNFVIRRPFAEDVRPLRILLPGQDAFDMVRQFILKRKWEVIAIKPPSEASPDAIIEAVDRSLVLAVPDDIVIRIQTNGEQSILDIRSAARYGDFDLGRNQARIQSFLDDFINLNDKVRRIKKDEPLYLQIRSPEVELPMEGEVDGSVDGEVEKQ